MVPPPNGTDPTSALALPCALVVTLASVVHGTCVPTKHTAVLKVWLGSAPLRVICAVEFVTTTEPKPGEFPVVWPMPPVMVAAGSNADLKLIPLVPSPETWSGNPLVSRIWKAPENVPFIGNVKFSLAVLVEAVANAITFTQLEKFWG